MTWKQWIWKKMMFLLLTLRSPKTWIWWIYSHHWPNIDGKKFWAILTNFSRINYRLLNPFRYWKLKYQTNVFSIRKARKAADPHLLAVIFSSSSSFISSFAAIVKITINAVIVNLLRETKRTDNIEPQARSMPVLVWLIDPLYFPNGTAMSVCSKKR